MKIIAILMIFLNINSLQAIERQNNNAENDAEKAVNIDFGLGSTGFSYGIGGRYWIFGVSIGFIGLLSNIPSYSYTTPNNIYLRPDKPLPQGYVEQRYTSLMINADINIYMDYFYPLTLIGAIGFFSQSDTILAYNTELNARYMYKNEKSDGLSIGLGAEYPLNEDFSVAVLIHSKRGFLVRMIYYFF